MNVNDIFKGLLFLEGSVTREHGYDHADEFRPSYGSFAANGRAFGSRYGHHQPQAQQAVPCCAGGCG